MAGRGSGVVVKETKQRYGPLIINLGNPIDDSINERIREAGQNVSGFLLPPGQFSKIPKVWGSIVYYCPAFDIVWGKSPWIGEGEYKIKMCPRMAP